MHPSVILLTALRKVQKDTHPGCGICPQVDYFLGGQPYKTLHAVRGLLDELFERWPKYSGTKDFPIRSPFPGLTEIEIYHNCSNLWDRSTEYGALRWELLEFCIAQLENGSND